MKNSHGYTFNRMEENRERFLKFANLCATIETYTEIKMNEKDNETLPMEEINNFKFLINIANRGMFLPSGRCGNQLAVALEMQLYIGALFMIENAEEIGIDLSYTSTEKDNSDKWDAQRSYLFSQLNFDFTKHTEEEIKNSRVPGYLLYMNKNIDAAIEINALLSKDLEVEGKQR